jgi:cysteine desulfurase
MPACRPVYADHHATTPLRPEALEAMLPWLSPLAANPSSIHAPGRAARKAVESAREAVAAVLGALPEEIVFTSGGTESDALGVRGGALAVRDREPARTRVAFSAAEHAAVREAGRALAGDRLEPVELPVDGAGLPRR